MAQRRVGFLFDAHLPPGLVDALVALGEPVEHVNMLFPPATPDETWIRYAGEREMCMVSRDMNITRRPHEQTALREAAVGAFFLLPGKRSPKVCQIIQAVIRHWPELKRLAGSERRPFQFQVGQRGVSRLR
jgi:PIN like domain